MVTITLTMIYTPLMCGVVMSIMGVREGVEAKLSQ